MKRTALVGAKVAVSAALLAYLLSTTDLRAIEEKLRAADLVDLLGAVLCFVLMLALATWRWQMLLGALGAPAPMRRLTASYLVATFFNNFLPSNIGGDIPLKSFCHRAVFSKACRRISRAFGSSATAGAPSYR